MSIPFITLLGLRSHEPSLNAELKSPDPRCFCFHCCLGAIVLALFFGAFAGKFLLLTLSYLA